MNLFFKESNIKIAVTGPTTGGYPAWFFTALQVWMAGGKAVYFPPQDFNETTISQFNGIILGGGADINPKLYNIDTDVETPDEKEEKIISKQPNFFMKIFYIVLLKVFNYESSRNKNDFERDLHEMKVIRLAMKKNIPILGICRGMQMINVFFGGKIDPKISRRFDETYPHSRSHWAVKKIRVQNNTCLYEACKKNQLKVNALHDQGILELGENLQVTSTEPNGVIQSIELEDHSCIVLGVQWHPEFMFYRKEQRKLFRWLVQSARLPLKKESLGKLESESFAT